MSKPIKTKSRKETIDCREKITAKIGEGMAFRNKALLLRELNLKSRLQSKLQDEHTASTGAFGSE